MGQSQGRAAVDRLEFFSNLCRKPLASSDGSAHARWITDGIVEHSSFILNDLERFDEPRQQLLQDLLDLNAETHRVEFLLQLAALGVDQLLCNAVVVVAGGGSKGGTGGSAASTRSGKVASPPYTSTPLASSTLASATQQINKFLCPLLRLTSVTLRFVITAAQGDAVLLSKQMDRAVSSAHGGPPTPSTTASTSCVTGSDSAAAAAPPAGAEHNKGNTTTGPQDPLSVSALLLCGSNGCASRLCERLLELTVHLPLDASTVTTHFEVTQLLLVLCSTQLHHPAAFDEQRMDVYVEHMLASELLRPVMATLLQRVVAWAVGLLPESTYLYRSGYQPSFRNLYNFFGMLRNEHCSSITDVLGRLSAHLLALLVVHQRGNSRNQAAECLQQLAHGEVVDFEMLLDAIAKKVVTTPAMAVILYVLLVDHPTFVHAVLVQWPDKLCDVVTSLLQLAVKTAPLDYHVPSSSSSSSSSSGGGGGHSNLRLANPVAVAPPPPLSSSSSTAAGSGPANQSTSHPPPPPAAHSSNNNNNNTSLESFQNIYVQCLVAAILCILSRDQEYHRVCFDKYIRPTFVSERYFTSVSLGSLTIAVCCKAVARALADKSEGLARLYLASIENASPFVQNLDAFAAQRLVDLLVTLLRRIHKIDHYVEKTLRANPSDTPFTLLAEAEMLQKPTEFLAETIAALIEGRNRSNHTLTYELLYNRSQLFLCRSEPWPSAEGGHAASEFTDRREQQLQRILKPVHDIIVLYEAELASVAVNHTPDDIMQLIQRTANSAGSFLAGGTDAPGTEASASAGANDTSGVGHSGRELLYLYQETAESGHFFTPCVWATILSETSTMPGALNWSSDECVGRGYFPLFFPDAM